MTVRLASPSRIRRPLRRIVHRAANGLLDRFGYTLVPAGPGPDARDATFDPLLHYDQATLPPDAAEVLRSDHPRLVQLRHDYSQLRWPVVTHSQWQVRNVEAWLNLKYFRGESIYMWQYREDSVQSQLLYFILLRHLSDRDDPGLLRVADEDGAFGCWTFEFEGLPRCSRDLLDSIGQLLFLDRRLSVLSADNLRVIDVGAGYGRLAHRAAACLPGLTDFVCVDAVPESTFLCEYYTRFRGVTPPVRVVPLPDVPKLESGGFDLATNIHSFSECPIAAIDWWMSQLSRLVVPKMLLVPNEPSGFLSNECQGPRQDYLPIMSKHGYRLVAEEHVIDDPAVRGVTGIQDRFCLFELSR